MAVKRFAGLELTVVEADTKPNHAGMSGYRSLETDTGRIHYHNGTSYSMLYGRDKTEILTNKTINSESNTMKNLGAASVFNLGTKRIGSVQPATTPAGALHGVIQNMPVHGNTVGSEFDTGENTFVQKFARDSTGFIGYPITSTNFISTRRAFNPFFKIRIKIDDVSDSRMMVGFITSVSTTTDTLIGNTASGVVWGYRTTDSNFMVFNNDGGGAMIATSTGVAKDTSYHTISFTFSASDVVVVMDDGAGAKTQTLTTRIPATSTDLFLEMTGAVV